MAKKLRGATGTRGKVASQLAQLMTAALIRKRDRSAVKSGELEPIIARQRNLANKATGYEIIDAKERNKKSCPHFTVEYHGDEESGYDRVRVWENHNDCLSSRALVATQGGHGTSQPVASIMGTFKGAGGRKTGTSSFQTHKVIKLPAQRQPCDRMVQPRDVHALPRPCGKSSAPGDHLCSRHGGVPRQARARNGKRVELLPEEMPMLAGDR